MGFLEAVFLLFALMCVLGGIQGPGPRPPTSPYDKGPGLY